MVCSWNMREVWGWEVGESGWRKGRDGVWRGATGREEVEREREWERPKGVVRGPFGDLGGMGDWVCCCAGGGVATGVGVLWECCCGCG